MNSCRQVFLNPNYTAEQAHADLVVPRLLYHLTSENPGDGDSITCYTEWALTRCFERGNFHVKLRSTGACSSFFATALYIIREASMYNASGILNNNLLVNRFELAGKMIRQVQNSYPSQHLSQWINRTRIKLRGEAKQDPVRVDVNGDFHVGNAIFRYNDITNLIPKIQKRLWHLMNLIFEEKEWMEILEGGGSFVVRNLPYTKKYETQLSH